MLRKPFLPQPVPVIASVATNGTSRSDADGRSPGRSNVRPPVLFRSTRSSAHESTGQPTESVVSMHAPEVAVNDPHHDAGMDAAAPAHPHLPSPTYWPAFLAFGITLLAWSLITSWVLTVVGILVMFVAIGGWIGDLLNEH